MNRAEKAVEVEELKSRFAKAQLTVVTDYKGLKVQPFTDLRRKLGDKQAKLKVVKNRLAKIAIKETSLKELDGYFIGTTAVMTTEHDVTAGAKVLTDFMKDNEFFKVKVGILDGKVIDLKGIEALAKMPSREELIAKMLGSLQAPMTNLASVLVQIPRQLVTVLDAVKRQKEQQPSS